MITLSKEFIVFCIFILCSFLSMFLGIACEKGEEEDSFRKGLLGFLAVLFMSLIYTLWFSK